MATSIDDELSQIGAALAAAGDGEPVGLTDEQRTVLASAHTADVLVTIAQCTPNLKYFSVGGGAILKIAEETNQIPAGLATGKRRATKAAVFDALATDSLRMINQQLAPIAAAWANEYRAAFDDPLTQQRITAALATDQPLAHITDLIREDSRLASYERDAILSILDSVYSRQQAMHGNAALPKTAYLSQLSVAGFRGIGPHSEINVAPQPGLTVVYGANGSGKSSFAEALDVLLTGTTGRFTGRGVEWRSAQTNVHKPKSGYVRAIFALGAHGAGTESFVRSWTDDGHLTGAYDKTPSEEMREIGWLDALDEFKPVLGYAELGPLLDEDTFGEATDSNRAEQQETPLARHIRLRAGISDPLVSSIQEAVQSNSTAVGQPFLQELAVWYRLALLLSDRSQQRVHLPTNDGLGITVGRQWRGGLAVLAPPFDQSPLHPRELKWDAFFRFMDRVVGVDNPLRDLRRKENEPGSMPMSVRFARYMLAPLLDLCRDFTTDEHRSILEPQATTPGWTSRAHVYCEMLIEAIYRARLATLSSRVKATWRKIRPGSSVQFHGIALHRVSQTGQSPALRASLDLALDGVRGVERGVLSQGELHSMALSVFLPALMRPESPFGFAVIDDPVQAMDEHAVDGLAEVLGNAAKDLQLIVFTHDKRLLEALHWQGIRHTQINVTRAEESVVTCEPVSDPVSQRIADARMLAEEAVADGEFRHRRNAAYQCRRAIEAACLRAVRGKFARQGFSHQQIESKVEVALRNKDTTTLRLLALAMFEDVGKQRDVRPRMKNNPDEWGKQQEIDTLAQVNALVHAVDLEAAIQSIVQAERDRHGRASDAERTERKAHAEREARAAFGRDPRDLVNDVEQLVKAIERNCV